MRRLKLLRALGDARRCLVQLAVTAGELARPPHPSPEVEVEGGDEDRANDEGVEQDAQGDGDPDLREGHDGKRS